MANWKEYTTKTTPEDADEIMIADTKANANKRTPFSGLWNWIAGKLATAVISQLETQNKSIIPALNELNSKSFFESKGIGSNVTYTAKLKDYSFGAIFFNAGNSDKISYLIFAISTKSDVTGRTIKIIKDGNESEKYSIGDVKIIDNETLLINHGGYGGMLKVILL